MRLGKKLENRKRITVQRKKVALREQGVVPLVGGKGCSGVMEDQNDKRKGPRRGERRG